MAKDAKDGTVTMTQEQFDALMGRLQSLEHKQAIHNEALLNPRSKILDPEWEAKVAEISRPAKERTQDKAYKLWGKENLWRVRLDSRDHAGKPGPDISEHPEILVSGHSEHEASGRYLELCGITKHSYRVTCEPQFSGVA